MNISDYIECINLAFEAKYKDVKGWFLYKKLYESSSAFPIYKKLNVTISFFLVGKDTEDVFTFTFQDKVPTGKELEFEDKCLLEIITTVTYLIDKIWSYGTRV